MKISVFGLGYVGTVTAACLADQGHEVWGVDINSEKVKLIRAGQSPIIEPGLPEKLEKGRKAVVSELIPPARLKVAVDVAPPPLVMIKFRSTALSSKTTSTAIPVCVPPSVRSALLMSGIFFGLQIDSATPSVPTPVSKVSRPLPPASASTWTSRPLFQVAVNSRSPPRIPEPLTLLLSIGTPELAV
ncbi:MAG: hypothetical protein IID32_11720 [Planctomycetes bacterium]|nr:hypothetical protein [Planctomycetota bacterium]